METSAPEDATKVKVAATKTKAANDLKLKFTVPEEHPLCQLSLHLRDRGIRNFDPSELILEVLEQKDSKWWEDRLEKETPLEFKINRALSDPNMRKKLKELISDTHGEANQLHS
ncbi:MAG: hypothetical protein OXT67_05275 [Zetaproteobacteria bacterium]|nr:hypothetical protein [Zetaproteobacteria bacterium]